MTIRVLIIFGSTYGYTERYANWIAEDLRALPQAPEVDTLRATEVTPELVAVAITAGSLQALPASRRRLFPLFSLKRNVLRSSRFPSQASTPRNCSTRLSLKVILQNSPMDARLSIYVVGLTFQSFHLLIRPLLKVRFALG